MRESLDIHFVLVHLQASLQQKKEKKKKSCGLMVSLQSEISESDEHSISQYL